MALAPTADTRHSGVSSATVKASSTPSANAHSSVSSFLTASRGDIFVAPRLIGMKAPCQPRGQIFLTATPGSAFSFDRPPGSRKMR
ncbi:hypothetical protein D3C85_1710120 [compost metagenome]